jgi:hypothetical protein
MTKLERLKLKYYLFRVRSRRGGRYHRLAKSAVMRTFCKVFGHRDTYEDLGWSAGYEKCRRCQSVVRTIYISKRDWPVVPAGVSEEGLRPSPDGALGPASKTTSTGSNEAAGAAEGDHMTTETTLSGLVEELKSADREDAAVFAVLVTKAMDTLKIEAVELAVEFSVSLPTVSRWRAGVNAPHTGTRGIVLDYLVGRANKKLA